MGLPHSKYPPKDQKMRKSFQILVIWDVRVQKCEVILDMNGVAVARHGLILWENEATGSRKVSKYLPGLRDAISEPKHEQNGLFTYESRN